MINIDRWAEGFYYECDRPPGLLYKLTDRNLESTQRLQWGKEQTRFIENRASKWMSLNEAETWIKKPKPYGRWLFAYTHPVIACLLYRSQHGPEGLDDPILWEATGNTKYLTVDKVALCSEMTTHRPLDMPTISPFTRMKFGFGCVAKVYKNELYQEWILDWVGDKDRSSEKSRRMASYCAMEFEGEQKKNGEFTAKSQAAWAAQWMCWAAGAYDHNVKNNLIEFWISQAAVEAAKAAHRMNNKDFDLVTIAEITMSAR